MHETISPPDHLKAMLQLCDGGVKETKEGFVRGFLSTASQCGSNLDTFLPMLLKEALAQTASDIGAWILILEPRDDNKRLIASKIQGHLSENGIRQWQAWQYHHPLFSFCGCYGGRSTFAFSTDGQRQQGHCT